MMIRSVVLLALLVFLAGCNKAMLFSELGEQQANEIQAVLLAHGVDADKKPATDPAYWAISVPKDSFALSVQLLRDRGLPRQQVRSMGEIFEKEGFVSSPVEERARYLYALSQELAATLMQIDGVVNARVHVALPERALLEENQDSASVSVVLIQEPEIDLSRYETDIKAIITDGVEGLDDVNRVTVKFFNRRAYSYGQPIVPKNDDTLASN
ncbi:MAG: type III secretion inner membrane ring lipoprotein SctJ [Pseudomonadales bacterium]|nr:type III secretion inner membrane ring lipoprotein SctJ [Pseudomonadales bacterium]